MVFMLIGMAAPAGAQGGLLQYNMQQLPQSNFLNPGQLPLLRGYLMLPGLSGARAELGTSGFNFNALEYNNKLDVYKSRFGEIGERLQDEGNLIFTAVDLPLFGVGLPISKGFFTFELREQTRLDLVYPKALFNMFHDVQQQSWGQQQQEGYLYDLSKLNVSLIQFLNTSVGYAYPITLRLSAGVRLHMYTGQFGAQTDNQNLVFRYLGDGAAFRIEGNMDLNSSGLGLFSANGEESFSLDSFSLFPAGNRGFGVDLGVLYQITDQIELSAGVNQLGSIRWKSDLSSSINQGRTIAADDVKAMFEGFIDVGEELIDAQPVQGRSKTFSTPLPTNFYVGGRFYPIPQFSIGVVANPVLYRGMFEFGAALSANAQVGKIFGISAAYTYNRHNPLNLGMATSLSLGPVQIYGVFDNILVLSGYRQARYFNAQAGVNLVFGKQARADLVAARKKEEKARMIAKRQEEANSEVALDEDGKMTKTKQQSRARINVGKAEGKAVAGGSSRDKKNKRRKPAPVEVANRPGKEKAKKDKNHRPAVRESKDEVAVADSEKVKTEKAKAPRKSRKAAEPKDVQPYYNFVFQTRDRGSKEKIQGVNMDIYSLEGGKRRLVFTGSAFSGVYSIPLERRFPHVMVVRKQGYDQEEVMIELDAIDSTDNELRRDVLLTKATPKISRPPLRDPEQEESESVPAKEEMPVLEAKPSGTSQAREPALAKSDVPERLSVGDTPPGSAAPRENGDQETNLEDLPFERTAERIDSVSFDELFDWFSLADEGSKRGVAAEPGTSDDTQAAASSEARFYDLTGETSLRSGPLHTYPVMLRFKPGDRVELLEKIDAFWWKVRFGEREGFVKVALLKAAL